MRQAFNRKVKKHHAWLTSMRRQGPNNPSNFDLHPDPGDNGRVKQAIVPTRHGGFVLLFGLVYFGLVC